MYQRKDFFLLGFLMLTAAAEQSIWKYPADGAKWFISAMWSAQHLADHHCHTDPISQCSQTNPGHWSDSTPKPKPSTNLPLVKDFRSNPDTTLKVCLKLGRSTGCFCLFVEDTRIVQRANQGEVEVSLICYILLAQPPAELRAAGKGDF